MSTPSTPQTALAIVGCGPRGTSVLERIIANHEGTALQVHVIEPHVPGSGATWQTNQHSSLLMNTTAATATVFTDETVDMRGPVLPGPTMYEWAQVHTASLPPDEQAEASTLETWTSPSRRLHGRYLEWAFEYIVATARSRGVEVIVHRARATDVAEAAGDAQLVTLESGVALRVDAVIMCLGHVDASSPRTSKDAFFPAVIIDQDIDSLTPGQDVIVRGTGLGLYDLIAMISHARGGRYTPTADSRYNYHASGKEPRFWVGSRRGFPFKAKPRPGGAHPWRFFSPSEGTLGDLRRRRGSLSFREDLWPRIMAGAAATYLVTAGAPEDDVAECVAAQDDVALVPRALDLLRTVSNDSYDPRETGDPLYTTRLDDRSEFHDHVCALLERDLRESDRGTDSAAKGADFAIGAARRWLHPLTVHGGLTPQSQRDDLDGWFDGYANSLAGGPPAHRVAELLALAEAGVVRFIGAGVRVDVADRHFSASSLSIAGQIRATAVVDARLAPFRMASSIDPLITSLRRRGILTPHTMRDGHEEYEDGRIAVDPNTRRVIQVTGDVHPRLFAIGVPVGGAGNASFTAMAQTSSPFLAETDAVAREALRAVGALRAEVHA